MSAEIASNIELREISEKLGMKLEQLTSMLVMILGEGQERFESVSEELRGQYLWACQEIASDCSEMAQTVIKGVYAEKAAA